MRNWYSKSSWGSILLHITSLKYISYPMIWPVLHLQP
uniref:Uncharacterized protein n=1 Tax=Arundo donax TaxID=35708 RepID=A0A0A9AJ19_ARUDO